MPRAWRGRDRGATVLAGTWQAFLTKIDNGTRGHYNRKRVFEAHLPQGGGKRKAAIDVMLTVLTKLFDQNRATELVDFILIFALLFALAMLVLFLLAVLRSRRLQKEIRESSSELYYFLLPTLALDGRDHQLIKHLAEFLPFPQQKHRIMVNPRIFDFCARRLLAARPDNRGAVADLCGRHSRRR